MNKLNVVLILCLVITSFGQTAAPPFPVKRDESPDAMKREAWEMVDRLQAEKPLKGKAKERHSFYW